MKIGLVDFDGRLTNLALMKLSAFYKQQGHEVMLNPVSPVGLDKTFVSLIFSKSRDKALSTYGHFPDVDFGGTGYSISKKLPDEIEAMRPDYDLYQVSDIYNRISGRIGKKENVMKKAEEIVNAGVGFLSRGCPRSCGFCVVPVKEGKLNKVGNIADIINPRSNRLVLLDNSLCANDDILEILSEIRDRNLVVDISQGIDVRLLTPEIAKALSEVKHMRSLHYAWDAPQAGKSVLAGIEILSRFVRRSAQMCFVLTGFDTDFSQDMERVMLLKEQGVRPYVMRFQCPNSPAKKEETFEQIRLRHFQRWVNAPAAIYKTSPFSEYEPWARVQEKLRGAFDMQQMELAWG
ncbi:radical SAM protein [Geomonas subterranea]|uniref:radical SAM protein n=1 Tax=Geomonas subterranea TaxID=2847989 RepID=UPI001CD71C67|nr:radical SAM protein [Geomonas fuzhouensis]